MKLTVGKNRTGVSMAIILLMLTTCSWTVAQAGGPSSADAGVKPSFDCVKATRPAEKMVCASPELSQLDAELQEAYAGALAHVERESRTSLIKEQRDWIAYVRNACRDKECLRSVYRSRISLLHENKQVIYDESLSCSTLGIDCGGVIVDRNPTVHIDEFNKSLSKNGHNGKVIGCYRLVEVAVGYANSETAYGAYCTLQNGNGYERVAICDDNMVGHFYVNSAPESQDSLDKLIQFTHSHCFGG